MQSEQGVRPAGGRGKVFLVGAGPGDPGLLTLRGRQCLERADVVVYDRLANERLLSYARSDAELIYVGKAANRHALPQEEINLLLVQKASEDKVVVRLKGGDPYIFGRGGEEAEVLRRHGIPFEEVPGVTSAVAAPAYAGIPLTHRGYASSLAIVTGHEDPTKGESSLRWEKLATATDTLVFLMGMENLEQIAEKLLAYGRPASAPVALVRWGTTADQEVLVGELGTIARRAAEQNFTSPAIIVVGEVVRLRSLLNWFEEKPLFGRRILVTRSRAQASALSDLLAELGAEPVEFPAIEIAPPESYAPLDEAIERLSSYHWVIFTSSNGVDAFLQRLLEKGRDARALGGRKLAAIGPGTAAALRRWGLQADYAPAEEFRAEGILAGFPAAEVAGRRFLLPRAAEARDVLPRRLAEQGARVDEVTAYRTVPARSGHQREAVRQLLEEGKIAAVTFTSSSTVRNFLQLLGEGGGGGEWRRLLAGVVVACIGPITAETARQAGLTVHVEAEEYTIPGLVRALVRYFEQSKVKVE
ncbi:MAG: uroporphyrinogen-III C-methyltransferase [Bacillota bacterium]|nr:uroporphyrinogen-III C-methyltransferase [Bacillota bacterium]